MNYILECFNRGKVVLRHLRRHLDEDIDDDDGGGDDVVDKSTN